MKKEQLFCCCFFFPFFGFFIFLLHFFYFLHDFIFRRSFSIGFRIQPPGCHFSFSLDCDFPPFFSNISCWKQFLSSAKIEENYDFKRKCRSLKICYIISDKPIGTTLKYECIEHRQKTSFLKKYSLHHQISNIWELYFQQYQQQQVHCDYPIES